MLPSLYPPQDLPDPAVSPKSPMTLPSPQDPLDPPMPVRAPSLLRHDGPVPVLVLPADLPFDDLREWLRERVAASLDEIGGRACRLDLGARDIALFDLRRLIHLLRDTFSLDVTALYVRPDAIHRFAERELKLKLFPTSDAPGATAAPPPEPAAKDTTPHTYFMRVIVDPNPPPGSDED